jgi:acyl-CoA thioesterase FadM
MNLLLRLFVLLFTAKRRVQVSVLGPSTTAFRVWLNDLDVLRHMNNGRYFSILDLARVDLMNRSGMWAKLKVAGWYPVVIDERMIFRRSLKLFDRYDVVTTVVGWDEKHVLMQQSFIRNDTEFAVGYVKARFLKRAGGSVASNELMRMAEVECASPLTPEQVAAWPGSLH